ncbi:hypothetical protein RJ639_018539 [Escallonia herrerae]|uniref:Xaa-Pro dipeptidase n=1 Tax=Escallonia herrerae TaxID=1293975 RepID=A0AA88VCT0_9ASTE|nr:hypothetical protein RJ639_018539 [Escallonia herrerae]
MAAASSPPPEVPMELHVANRVKLVESLRQHLSLSSRPLHGFVFLQGGEEKNRYCTDHVELFRQESYFAFLFGVREPGFYGAIDIATGNSILFAPRLSEEYAVWLGEIKPLTYFKDRYMVSMAFYTDEIVKVLHEQCQQSEQPLLFLLHGLNTDSNLFSKPAEFEGIEKFEKDLGTLHPILTECRVLKTDTELAVIQFANDISSEAHVEIWTAAGSVVGGLHRRVEVSGGRDVVSGSGGGGYEESKSRYEGVSAGNSVLHYGHAAAPNERTLQDGDMALLDMGAEFNFYGSDITCSFPVNGKFTSEQRLIYNAVLNAHNAVISSMKPGVSWVDMHILAEKTVLEALKQGGLLVGDVDNMMIERLGAVFMPHGLGHFLGIDTHDPGGYLKVITVEPGCYFIDVLLVPAMESSRTSKFLKSEEISKFRGFGGVRIESDVYVTSNGCVNMTKCPREVHDIEAVMAGAPWPIKKTSIHFEARES